MDSDTPKPLIPEPLNPDTPYGKSPRGSRSLVGSVASWNSSGRASELLGFRVEGFGFRERVIPHPSFRVPSFMVKIWYVE